MARSTKIRFRKAFSEACTSLVSDSRGAVSSSWPKMMQWTIKMSFHPLDMSFCQCMLRGACACHAHFGWPDLCENSTISGVRDGYIQFITSVFDRVHSGWKRAVSNLLLATTTKALCPGKILLDPLLRLHPRPPPLAKMRQLLLQLQLRSRPSLSVSSLWML